MKTKRMAATAIIPLLGALLWLTCTRHDTVTAIDDYGTAALAPRVLYKNAATANQLPPGLDSTVAHIAVGTWETTVSRPFPDRIMTIDSVPVGSGHVMLLCLDAFHDTVYRGESDVVLVKNIVAQPPVTLAPAAPGGLVLLILSPRPDYRVNADNITINGYVEAPAGIMLLSCNGAALSYNATSFSATVPLVDGSNLFTFLVLDNAGNTQTRRITIVRDAAAVDRDPPQIVVNQPVFVNDTAVVGVANCQLSGTIIDASAVIFFSVNEVQLIPGSGNSWSRSVSLTQGVNQIRLRARDDKNNEQRDTLFLVYNPAQQDTVGPALAVTSPQQGATVQQSQLTVVGNAADPSGIKEVRVSVNAGAPVILNPSTGGDFSTTIAIDTVNAANTIHVRAIDTRDNFTEVTRSITYNSSVVDSIGPNVQITQPANGYVSANAFVTIAGTAIDQGVGVRQVTVTVNGTPVTATYTNPNWSVAVTLPQGADTITATAEDLSNNRSSTTAIYVTYNPQVQDTTGPVITIVNGPRDKQTVSASHVVWSGTIEDQSSISSFTVNGAAVQPSSGIWQNYTDWSVGLDLAAGQNQIVFTARDNSAAKNATEQQMTVVYLPSATNNPPNTPSNPFPVDGAISQNTAVQVRWNGGDPDSGSQVIYTLSWDTLQSPLMHRVTDLAATMVTLDKLNNGTKYFWKISASDGQVSVDGPVWAFTTGGLAIRPFRMQSVGNVTDTSLSIKGQIADNPNVDHYEVRRSLIPGVKETDSLAAGVLPGVGLTEFPIRGLSQNTVYYFRVYTIGKSGCRVASDEFSATTACAMPPAVAAKIDSVEATRIMISWLPVQTPHFSRYLIVYDTAPAMGNPVVFDSIAVRNSRADTITGLAGGTVYYIQVRVYNGPAIFSAGPAVSARTKISNHAPNAPSNPAPSDGATIQDTVITMLWSGGDPDAGDIVRYTVYLGQTPATMIAIDSNFMQTSYGLTGLAWGTNYLWRIDARDTKGAVTPGPLWRFTTRTGNRPPSAPFNPVPAMGAAGVDTGGFSVSWSGGFDPDAGDTVSFDIYRGTDSTSMARIIAGWRSWSYPFCCLNFGTTYYWRVIAYDNKGAQANGPVWKFTTRIEPGNWQIVPGSASLNYGLGLGEFSFGFCMDTSGAPVLAYPDGSNSATVVVKRYSASGQTWDRIGPYLPAGSYGVNLSIDPASSAAYVAHATGASGMPLTVEYLSGGQWIFASAGMPSQQLPLGGYQYEIPLSVSNDQPVICAGLPGPFQLYSYSGSSWKGMMTGLAGEPVDRCGSVAISTKQGASAFIAYTTSTGVAKVVWNNSGYAYDATGPSGFPDADSTASPYFCFARVGDSINIAYRMDAGNGYRATVRTYAGGQSWFAKGAVGVSDGAARDLALAAGNIDNVLYCAYVDQQTGLIVLKRFTGNSWIETGKTAQLSNTPSAYHLKLAVAQTRSREARVYLAYIANGSPMTLYVYMMDDMY